MQVHELWHVNIVVTDIAAALAFYGQLGLREIQRAGTPQSEGAWLAFPDGRELHLSVGAASSTSRAHFAVIVDDLAAARKLFTSLGAPIEPARDLPRHQRFFVRDPDGNRLEIAQRS